MRTDHREQNQIRELRRRDKLETKYIGRSLKITTALVYSIIDSSLIALKPNQSGQ